MNIVPIRLTSSYPLGVDDVWVDATNSLSHTNVDQGSYGDLYSSETANGCWWVSSFTPADMAVVDNSTDMPCIFNDFFFSRAYSTSSKLSNTRCHEYGHGSHTRWIITIFSVSRKAFPMWCTAYYWSPHITPGIELSYPELYMPVWVSTKRFTGVSFRDTRASITDLRRNDFKLAPFSHAPSHGFISVSIYLGAIIRIFSLSLQHQQALVAAQLKISSSKDNAKRKWEENDLSALAKAIAKFPAGSQNR